MNAIGTVTAEVAEVTAEATPPITVESVLAHCHQLSLRDRQGVVETLTGRPFSPPAEWVESRAAHPHEVTGVTAEAPPQVTVESILAEYNQLSLRDRQRLVETLTGRYFPPPAEWFKSRVISTNAPYNPRTQEFEWRKQHQYEYIGEWVAVEGDQLIAHSPDMKEVFAEVRRKGADAILMHMGDPDRPFVAV